MGYHGRATGHGFRATASTLLNEMGWKPDVIERQLAHQARNKVRAAYHRSEYLSDRCRMMQAWSDFLDALKGKQPLNAKAQPPTRRMRIGRLERLVGRHYSAVVGSIIEATSEIRFAGKPPCWACSRTIFSFGAMYMQ
jgi:hypothetical protein